MHNKQILIAKLEKIESYIFDEGVPENLKEIYREQSEYIRKKLKKLGV